MRQRKRNEVESKMANEPVNKESDGDKFKHLIRPAVTILVQLKGWDIKYLPLGRSIVRAINQCQGCSKVAEHGDHITFEQTQGDIQNIVYRARIPLGVLLKIFFISLMPWYRSVYDLKAKKMRDNSSFSFPLTAQFYEVVMKDGTLKNRRGEWKMIHKVEQVFDVSSPLKSAV